MDHLKQLGILPDRLSAAIAETGAYRSQLSKTLRVNPAEWMYERIVRSIQDFEEKLDSEHEIGARLVSFGANTTFHIDDVSFWGPDMIIFIGFDENKQRVELLQHISQVNVLLVAVNKQSVEPRRIGFRLVERVQPSEE